MRILATTLATAALVLMAGLGSAHADTSLQDQVDEILLENPGGTQTGLNTISWESGAIELTLAVEGGFSTLDVGTCETGRYCAYSGFSYSGTKLSFTACSAGGSSASLALLGNAPRSAANARTSGSVSATNGGTAVFSMGANTGRTTVTGSVSSLVCYT